MNKFTPPAIIVAAGFGKAAKVCRCGDHFIVEAATTWHMGLAPSKFEDFFHRIGLGLAARAVMTSN